VSLKDYKYDLNDLNNKLLSVVKNGMFDDGQDAVAPLFRTSVRARRATRATFCRLRFRGDRPRPRSSRRSPPASRNPSATSRRTGSGRGSSRRLPACPGGQEKLASLFTYDAGELAFLNALYDCAPFRPQTPGFLPRCWATCCAFHRSAGNASIRFFTSSSVDSVSTSMLPAMWPSESQEASILRLLLSPSAALDFWGRTLQGKERLACQCAGLARWDFNDLRRH
jgi:hypothetical protein